MSDIFVTFTFDDGNISQYVYLYLILDEYGHRATFYVTSSQVGLRGKMSRDQIQELRKKGNEIGSHAHVHVPLTGLPDRKLELELKLSKELLRASTFAYPFGCFDKKTIYRVKEHYLAARAYGTSLQERNLSTLQRYALRSMPLDNILMLPSEKFESIISKTFSKELIGEIANRVEIRY